MSIELLKRLHAVLKAASWEDAQLVADTLSYISALEHTISAPSHEVSLEQLMFMLGQAHGALRRNRASLTAAVRHGATIPYHVVALRDCLNAILNDAGVEVVQ